MNLKSKHPTCASETRIGDAYIWAEIRHLDSNSDYREFLPTKSPPGMSPGDDLVLLDDEAPRWLACFTWLLVFACFGCAFLCAAGLFDFWI